MKTNEQLEKINNRMFNSSCILMASCGCLMGLSPLIPSAVVSTVGWAMLCIGCFLLGRNFGRNISRN